MLGKGSDNAFGGAFLGYNTQVQDVIIGVEATYNHTNLNTTASSSAIARIFPIRKRCSRFLLNATGRLNLNRLRRSTGSGWIYRRRFVALRLHGRCGGASKLQRVNCSGCCTSHEHIKSRLFLLEDRHNDAGSPIFSLNSAGQETPCSGGSRSASDWIGR